MANKIISIISPVYNEEEVICSFVSRLVAVCKKLNDNDYKYEIILVNDGSTDNTIKKLNSLSRKYSLTVMNNRKNCGQQRAILTGLGASRGVATVVLDSDLQDPPEYIPMLINAWEKGADVVMCEREKREDSPFKRITAFLFYWFINLLDNNLPTGCGDFYLLDRKIVDKILKGNYNNLYLRGLVARSSHHRVTIPIIREPRKLGSSSYTLRKMLTLAKDGLFFAFSNNEK